MWTMPTHNIEEYIKFYFRRYRGTPKTCTIQELRDSFNYDCSENFDFTQKELETQFMNTLHKLDKTENFNIEGSKVTGDYLWPPERINWKPNLGGNSEKTQEKE